MGQRQIIISAFIWFVGFVYYIRGQHATPQFPLVSGSRNTPWSQISPSKSLVYYPCYDGLQCARLEVPLDWQNSTASEKTVAIALLKRPAKVPVKDPRYGGAIFINPGGPGGSGVRQALSIGKQIQTIVDSPAQDGKFFDIIGFDPRGIGYSTPKLECFPDYRSRLYWESQAKAEGLLGSSDIAFDIKWSRWQSLAQSCMARAAEEGEESIAYYMNTAPLVADLVELVERHGEWREKEARTLISRSKGVIQWFYSKRSPPNDSHAVPDRCKWRKGQERLLYWGLSYGTVIGQSFAALHPDRVSRFVLDAVVSPSVYLNRKGSANIHEADAVFDRFFEYCSKSTQCAVHAEDPESIRTRFNELLSSVSKDPIPVPASNSRSADVITVSDVRFEIKEAVYCPVQKYPQLAQLFLDLGKRNGSSLADRKQSRLAPPPYGKLPHRCNAEDAFTLDCHRPDLWEDEASMAIICLDTESVQGLTKEAYKDFFEMLTNRSWVMGYYWAELQMACVDWKIRPRWRYDGPLRANTSEPILFIGNTLDPVTPLKDAIKVSESFPGSSVLHQDSVGHGWLSSPSLCTAKVIRNYFQSGTLPKPGTVCNVEEYPFQQPGIESLSDDDRRLLSELREAAYRCRS